MLVELAAAVGLAAGLGALGRGLRAQRMGARVEGVGTSPIATLAAGEVRITGVVEPAGVTLTSPILGLPVVYYDSRVRSGGEGEPNTWQDARAVSFFVRDGGASIRVLPGGASWDMPLDIDDSSGLARPMGGLPGSEAEGFDGLSILAGAVEARPRRMTEACLEPGDRVTVIGRALPFGDLADPANATSFSPIAAEDPEIAADLAAARAAGTLADDPAEAWGNAAIPGFGIGQPVRPPELEAGVAVPAIAGPAVAATAAATFDISPDVLVLASTDDAPLLIAGGEGRGRRAQLGRVPARPPRRRPCDRLGDRPRVDARAETRRVTLPDPATLALGFTLILLAIVLGFVVLTTYNDVVALANRIETAWSNVDVALKQRHDQLPALVDAVRGVLAFERDTLVEVTRRRAEYAPSAPIPQQAATSEATTAALRSLFAVVERYPELRSTTNVLELQAGIERLEDTIAARRELYNDQVFRYNTRIGQFPGVIVATLFGWTMRPFFRAEPGDRNVPASALP